MLPWALSSPPIIEPTLLLRNCRSRMASNCPATAVRCASGDLFCSPRREKEPGSSPVAATELMAETSMGSVDDQLGLQGAGALQGLEDRHHVAGRDAEGVERRGQPLDGRRLVEDGEPALAALVHAGLRAVG